MEELAIKGPWDRNAMLDQIGLRGKICAEIGVLRGDYSAEILKRNPAELYLVDPWEHQAADDYQRDKSNCKQEEFDQMYNGVRARFAKNYNVGIYRMYSHRFFCEVQREFSFSFIDANHSYAHVLADLMGAYLRIKDGGWICGHDYGQGPNSAFPGVPQAVSSFCQITGNEIEFLTQEDYWASFAIKVKK